MRTNSPTPTVRGAILYRRVSTDEQVQSGMSLNSQVDVTRATAAELGLPIVAEIADEGVSGGLFMARPGLQQALRIVEEGRVSHLVVYDLSRLSRNLEHCQIIRRALEEARVRLVLCTMGEIGDTPEDHLNLDVQGSFAAFERRKIRERSMRGKKERAKDGLQPLRAVSSYGYHIPTKNDVLQGLYTLDQLGKYIVLPVEAQQVRRLFELYDTGGYGLPALVRVLNSEGVPAKKRTNTKTRNSMPDAVRLASRLLRLSLSVPR